MSLKLRQQKYRERQKKLGRKTITIQLPVELIDALHAGKNSDTLSVYVERVLRAGLKKTVTNNNNLTPKTNEAVTNNDDIVQIQEKAILKSHDWDADEKKFADDIEMSKYRHVQSLAESGNTTGAIAKKLTFDGYPTPKGKTRWTAALVRAMLKKQK